MKIHTTKLYVPSNGESNSAEISVEIPNGTGQISLSIQKSGSSNHILGPNGWQSADYWFNGTPSEGSNNNVAWFSLPAQLVVHITYSNYSVFCRRIGISTPIRTILTGGALVAKPVNASLSKGDIELPPLPTDFSQAALGSLAAVEESYAAPKIPTVQSETVSTLPTAESKVAIHSAETESAPPASEKAAVFDAPIPKQAPSSTTQQPRFDSNRPLLLGLLVVIFLVVAVYFFGFRNDGVNNAQPPVSTIEPKTSPKTAPENDGVNNAQPPVSTIEPKTSPKTAPENGGVDNAQPPVSTIEPKTAPETAPAKPEMPEMPTKDGSEIVKPNSQEVKQAPTKFPSSVTSEPTQSVPTPEKAQPPGFSAPDLNRMVNEALKR